jgi:hypothetical protein
MSQSPGIPVSLTSDAECHIVSRMVSKIGNFRGLHSRFRARPETNDEQAIGNLSEVKDSCIERAARRHAPTRTNSSETYGTAGGTWPERRNIGTLRVFAGVSMTFPVNVPKSVSGWSTTRPQGTPSRKSPSWRYLDKRFSCAGLL